MIPMLSFTYFRVIVFFAVSESVWPQFLLGIIGKIQLSNGTGQHFAFVYALRGCVE